MRRTTFSVVFFCKKARISKKGKAPIYARITTSGLSTEIYTRCQIEPERWNQRLERSLHRDKVALQINGIVDSYRANILTAYDALIREGRIPDCFTIKGAARESGRHHRLFLAEFSKYCEKRQQGGRHPYHTAHGQQVPPPAALHDRIYPAGVWQGRTSRWRRSTMPTSTD